MTEEHAILVVEDDDDVREITIELLESLGYAALPARHGKEALDQLHAGLRPCVILLDLMMPVMDGWTFCEELQKDEALAVIPVVVASAASDQQPRNACLHAVGYFTKPIDLNELLAAVRRHCLPSAPA